MRSVSEQLQPGDRNKTEQANLSKLWGLGSETLSPKPSSSMSFKSPPFPGPWSNAAASTLRVQVPKYQGFRYPKGFKVGLGFRV